MSRPILISCLAVSLFGIACGSSEGEEQAAPVIVSFEARPPTIDPGMASTLSWEVRSAERIEIAEVDGETIELGPAELEAQEVEVRPAKTTQYRLTVRGHDGSTLRQELRVSVRTNQLRLLAFEAAPPSIREGESTTLSWSAENATSVRLFANGSEVPLGEASPTEGSVVHEPRRSTSYTLRVSNERDVREATISVEVQGGLGVELLPDRARIGYGEETTLRWRSRSATRVELRAGDRVLIDGSTDPTGSLAVSPTETTTYQITAFGEGRSVTDTATVRVAPVIESFTASDPGPLARGETLGLAWEVRGAEGVRLSDGAGWSHEGGPEGVVETRVPMDGRFFLEAWRGEEKVTERLVIPILERPEVQSFTATPSAFTLDEGESAEIRFTWEAPRAAAVEIRDEAGTLLAEGPERGDARVVITEGGIFSLTARNAAGTATRLVEVKTHLPPAIESFAAWPAHVGAGEAFELRWETRASAIEILRDGQLVYSGAGGTGSRSQQIASASTFTLRAMNEVGAVTAESIEVSVGPPVILSFSADRSIVGPGSDVVFEWSILGGTSLTWSGPGAGECSTTDLERIPAGSCAVRMPTEPGELSFTLRVENDLGQSREASLVVEVVDGPAIFDFYANRSRVTREDELTVSWSVGVDADGQAPTLELRDGDDVYDLGAATPLTGSAVILPKRSGVRTFRLTASTPGTTPATRELTVTVVEPPSLHVLPPAEGYVPGEEPVLLGWETEHAVEVEVLALEDDGTALPIGWIVDPSRVRAGSIELHPREPGQTYRLVATNEASRSVEAEVFVGWAPAKIDLFEAVPDTIAVWGFTTLLWSARGEPSISIVPRPLETTGPFIDLGSAPTAQVVALSDCGGEGCADISLPFDFPYGGQLFGQARVLQNGAISFDTSHAGDFEGIEELPSSAAGHIALAPFWQPLVPSVPGGGRVGRILYDQGADAKGAFVVIQWEGFWSQGATAGDAVDLNFQVVLYTDGDFDFRYGRMVGAGVSRGEQASIGYQLPGGVEGRSLSFQQALDTGLDGFAFGIRLGSLPAIGSLQALPLSLGTTAYRLVAENGAGSTQVQASVTAVDGVRLEGVHVIEEFPEVGQAFTLAWTAVNASEVRVERPRADPEDPLEAPVVLCVLAPTDDQSCQLTESAPGTYTYVVRALGLGWGDEFVVEHEVELLSAFSIDAFQVTPEEITAGQQVTVSWATTGAEGLTLTANGNPVDITGLPLQGGSVQVEVWEDTVFVLTAESQGRSLTETVEVEVAEEEG